MPHGKRGEQKDLQWRMRLCCKRCEKGAEQALIECQCLHQLTERDRAIPGNCDYIEEDDGVRRERNVKFFERMYHKKGV